MLASWQTREIYIEDQESLLRVPVSNGLTLACVDDTDGFASLMDIDIGKLIQHPRDSGLVGK